MMQFFEFDDRKYLPDHIHMFSNPPFRRHRNESSGIVYSDWDYNKHSIRRIAQQKGRFDISQSIEGRRIQFRSKSLDYSAYKANPNGEYKPITDLDPFWRDASCEYCNNLSGDVTTCVAGAKANRDFRSVELLTLISNRNVTSINRVPRENFEQQFKKIYEHERQSARSATNSFYTASFKTYQSIACAEINQAFQEESQTYTASHYANIMARKRHFLQAVYAEQQTPPSQAILEEFYGEKARLRWKECSHFAHHQKNRTTPIHLIMAIYKHNALFQNGFLYPPDSFSCVSIRCGLIFLKNFNMFEPLFARGRTGQGR